MEKPDGHLNSDLETEIFILDLLLRKYLGNIQFADHDFGCRDPDSPLGSSLPAGEVQRLMFAGIGRDGVHSED